MELKIEDERRFLVRRMPVHYLKYPCRPIAQWYICLDPPIRVREEGSDCYLTIKIKKEYGKDYEFEWPVSIETVPILAAVRKHNKIFKTRFLVSNLELNVFLVKLDGIVMLEFEKKTESDVPKIPLDFSVLEVTGDERFRGHNLIKLESVPEEWKCEIV